jgi:hypothetical protein
MLLQGRIRDVIGPVKTSLEIYTSDSHIIYQLDHLEATYDQRTQNSWDFGVWWVGDAFKGRHIVPRVPTPFRTLP